MAPIQDTLRARAAPLPLAIFRIALALLLAWDVVRWLRADVPEVFFSATGPRFAYAWLSFYTPSAEIVRPMLYVQLVALGLVALGVFHRWAMVVVFITFSAFFFGDRAIYNNHLYLISLITFSMIFVPADAAWALRPNRSRTALAGHVWLLRFHIVLVYFYGGLAKLNTDWLIGREPVREMLRIAAERHAFLAPLSSDAGCMFFSWSGTLFDLAIGFLLLSRRTRRFAVPFVVVFHLMNGLVLFDDIYIFPFFMIAATVLFFEFGPRASAAETSSTLPGPLARKLWLGYLALQLLLPFRSALIAGNARWTQEGQLFSWRMKDQVRQIDSIQFLMSDKDGPRPDYRLKLIENGKAVREGVSMSRLQAAEQLSLLGSDPEAVWNFARHLERVFREVGEVKNMEIRAAVRVSLNGRKPQWLVDPNVNLLGVSYSAFRHNAWIMPLESE